MKFVIFIAMFAVGVLILRYNEPIVRMVGKSSFAEKYLGMGGTYTMWKLIAVVIMIVGYLYVMGMIQFGDWNLNLDSKNTQPEITDENY